MYVHCRLGVFVIQLRQISSLFILYDTYDIKNVE